MATAKETEPTGPRVLGHEMRMCPVADLIPHPRNARKHADAILDESIAANGIYKPVVASTASGYILAGHGVLERAKQAGIVEMPVYWLDGLTPADELKILAADNRASDLSPGYDEKALAELLQAVQSEGDGFQGTGFTQEGLDKLIESAADAILQEAEHQAALLKNDAKDRAATLRKTVEAEPEFAPDSIENQGKLDKKKMTCPECGHEFTA
jgi:ParB-like chromosome segregation protein Spo0J